MAPSKRAFAGLLYAGRQFLGALFTGVGSTRVPPPSEPAGFWTCLDAGRNWTCLDAGNAWILSMSTQPAKLSKKSAASRTYFADFAQYAELREGDALSGTPTVAASPSGLTVSGATVSGAGVLFRVSGGTAGTDYTLSVSCGTTGGNTLAEDVVLSVY